MCDALESTLAVEKASVTDVLPHRTAVVSAAHTLMRTVKASVSKSCPKWSIDIATACNSKRFFNVVYGVLVYCILEINTRSLIIILVARKYKFIRNDREVEGHNRVKKRLKNASTTFRYNSGQQQWGEMEFCSLYWLS